MLKRAIQFVLRRFSRDLAPYPLSDWYVLRAAIVDIFEQKKINCVIDVGAHFGTYGEFLRNSGFSGTILSFEPVPSTFEKLTECARGDARWRCINCALGAENIETKIHVMRGSDFSSFLRPNALCSEYFPNSAAIEAEPIVKVRRLDAVLDSCLEGIPGEQRIYLKMDTQGFDLSVLEGSAGVLDRVLALQTEVSVQGIYSGMPTYLESIERITALGFRPATFVPVSRDRGLAAIEFDCVMVRAPLHQ